MKRAAAFLIALTAVMTIIGLFEFPYPVNFTDPGRVLEPPSPAHIFGTDNLGRDVFSRVCAGGKYTLASAFGVTAVSLIAGTILGVCAGRFRGAFAAVVSRLADTISAFPGILIALVIAAVTRGGLFGASAALTIIFLPFYVRVARNETRRAAALDFIKSARVAGYPERRVIFSHIVPNIAPALAAAAALGFANAVLSEASLSFLGLGIQPPAPSWGRMLSEAGGWLAAAPWTALFPGAAVAIAAAGFTLAGRK